MSQFTDLIDLAAERLGGAVLLANDEFFAPKEALLKTGTPEWREGAYTDRGKWMDGWESRRRRTPGHDWCIVKLGLPGVIHSVVVDTAFFRGNFPSHCWIDGCGLPPGADPTDGSVTWHPVLERSESDLLQSRNRNLRELFIGEIGKRCSTPKRKSLLQ